MYVLYNSKYEINILTVKEALTIQFDIEVTNLKKLFTASYVIKAWLKMYKSLHNMDKYCMSYVYMFLLVPIIDFH